MFVYKMTIAYDGTAYSGWQVQPNAISIQQILQGALQTILRVPEITIIGSGRTDAGVHALGQVAHFRYAEELNLGRLQLSLNGLIPADIRIKKIELAPSHFHAQYSAIGKEYHYHIHLERVLDPFRRHYSWHLYTPIDKELLLQACQLFVGTHDFTSFANEAHAGSASRNPVRTIYRVDPIFTEEGVRIEFHGNGFLYKMVRNIVGAVAEVATGKRSLKEIQEIFAAKDRRRAGLAAPPKGLFLVRVDYPT